MSASKSNNRHITPKVAHSGFSEVLTNADTDYPIQIPNNAVAVQLFFMNGSNVLVIGRVGFSGNDQRTAITVTDGDATLGYHPDFATMFYFSDWSKWIHLASHEAGTIARGMWYYD